MDIAVALSIVSIVLGLIGALVGVGTAIWVYRRERADRRKEAAHRERAEQETRRAEQERHARDVRRAKHENDYRAAQAALEKLNEIADNVRTSGLLTESGTQEAGIEGLQAEIYKLSDRLERLETPLVMAWNVCNDIEDNPIPDSTDPTIRKTVWMGIRQYLAAQEVETRVKTAMYALNKEWET
jgi:hypothetical protein